MIDGEGGVVCVWGKDDEVVWGCVGFGVLDVQKVVGVVVLVYRVYLGVVDCVEGGREGEQRIEVYQSLFFLYFQSFIEFEGVEL